MLNIQERQPEKLLKILQSVSADDIAQADRTMLTVHLVFTFQFMTFQCHYYYYILQRYMAFNPTFDGRFIHKNPTESLADGPLNRVPYIIGCNDSEGHGILTLLPRTPHYETGMTEDTTKVFISNFLPRMSVSSICCNGA